MQVSDFEPGDLFCWIDGDTRRLMKVMKPVETDPANSVACAEVYGGKVHWLCDDDEVDVAGVVYQTA